MKSFLLSITVVLTFFYFSYSAEYIEGEVLIKLKKSVISPQSNKNPEIHIAGTDIKVQSVFKQGNEQIFLVKSKTKTTEELIQQLKNNPLIEKVEPNYIIKPTRIPNDKEFSKDTSLYWGFEKIKAPEAWDITTGSNDIVVAVLDTGVDYKHPDLKDNIWKNSAECNGIPGKDDDNDGYIDDCIGYDMFDNDNDPSPGNVDNIHGTHVSGIIGAVGNNNEGIAGVNWRVKLLPCKIFDDGGDNTTLEIIIKCLNYITRLKERGVNIVASNNSWAGSKNVYLGDILKEAIQESINAGILFITAAGNQSGDFDPNNDNIPVYPCNYKLDNDGLICVAATDKNDRIPWFSYYGSKSVDLAAPGWEIYSTVPTGILPIGRYDKETGTSMAAPFVTGAAALLKSKYPYLNWRDIKATILVNVDELPDLKGKLFTDGRLNLYKMLENPVKSIDGEFGIKIKPDEYTIIDSGFVNKNDYTLDTDSYTFFKKPFYIRFTTGIQYAGIKLSLAKSPEGIKVAFCEPITKVCSLIDESLIEKYGNNINIGLEDNSRYDYDNDIGVVKSQLAFVVPKENSNTLKDSEGGVPKEKNPKTIDNGGSGAGCSLSKKTDFSLLFTFVSLLVVFGLRKFNKLMQLRSNQV